MKQNSFNSFLRKCFYLIPRSGVLYKISKRYVDNYNGENNCDMYTNGEVKFLKMHLSRNSASVFFDVGANQGKWTEVVLSINPKAVIHCFEPCRATFAMLQKKNFPENVVLNDFGLSSASGKQAFFVFGSGHGQNSLYLRHNKSPQTMQEICLLRIDDYCSRQEIHRIDFLKIDVEGHEFEVIQGAEEMLKTGKIQVIQFEYGENYIEANVLLKDIIYFMGKFRYTLHKIMPFGLKPIKKYDTILENYVNANYLFLSESVRI